MIDNIWQFIDNNIEWIMGGGFFFIGVTLLIGWIKFCNILIKAGRKYR